MPRVKGGPKTRQRRKKVLKMAKGYVGGRRRLYRTAVDAVHRALAYAYRDRRLRKRDFRRLWIARINAAARLHGISYSRLLEGLEKVQEETIASLAQALTEKEISEIRIRVLGRKGSLTQLLKRLGALAEAERREIGRRANEIKEDLEARDGE